MLMIKRMSKKLLEKEDKQKQFTNKESGIKVAFLNSVIGTYKKMEPCL